VLDDLGLAAAVEWLAQEFETRTGIRCELAEAIGDGAIAPAISTALFRILQESLTNVARHAGATRVAIDLRREDRAIQLDVRDDGRGIRREQVVDGRAFGLIGMRERAELLNGRFLITRVPEGGTHIHVSIPDDGLDAAPAV
jgi:signal transduction histidine kinase